MRQNITASEDQQPLDTVTQLQWIGVEDRYLAACGYDGMLRAYSLEYGYQRKLSQSMSLFLGQPCISMAMASQTPIVGLANGLICSVDLATKNVSIIGRHQGPITTLGYHHPGGILISGSTDQKVKFWQLNNPQPINIISLKERVLAGDLVSPLLVMGLSNENTLCWNLDDPSSLTVDPVKSNLGSYSVISSIKLNYQHTNCMIGGIDGRINICSILKHYNSIKLQSRVVFKACKTEGNSMSSLSSIHKAETIHYVNSIDCNPNKADEFVVGGGGNKFCIWDVVNRTHTKSFEIHSPVTAVRYSPTGKILAYAMGNDWSSGMMSLNRHNARIYIECLY